MSELTGFKKWYAENKEKLAEDRRRKYAEDPEYREQMKARSAEFRDRKRAEKPDQEYKGMLVPEVCEALEVKEWTLNSWKNRGYYPAPSKTGGRPVFTENQVSLLGLIKQFFQDHPRRVAGLHRDKLGVIVDVVHHNWNQ